MCQTEDNNCLRRDMEEFLDEIRAEELTVIGEASTASREESEFDFDKNQQTHRFAFKSKTSSIDFGFESPRPKELANILNRGSICKGASGGKVFEGDGRPKFIETRPEKLATTAKLVANRSHSPHLS